MAQPAPVPVERPRERAWPWLIYLAFYPLTWLWTPPEVRDLAIAAAAMTVFLPIYFWTHGARGPRMLWGIAAMLALSLALGIAGVNGQWGVFAIYAASAAGRIEPRALAISAIATTLLGVAALGVGLDLPWAWWVPTILIAVTSGISTIALQAFMSRTDELLRSREELRAMALVAERERIGRDMHDALGRTLVAIALKADLAARRRSGDADTSDIAEIAALARSGLTDVRSVLDGVDIRGLAQEVYAAEALMRDAGIELAIAPAPDRPPPAVEAVLAQTLREAITNVARHASAGTCRVAWAQANDKWCLTVEDDGVGWPPAAQAGRGLTGLERRLAAMGGALQMEGGPRGTRLTASLPA